MLLLELYCETIIRSSGEKSVKFHEDHSLVFFTPTLSHRLWRCQLPFREHIWVSGGFKNYVSQVGYISPERGGGYERSE